MASTVNNKADTSRSYTKSESDNSYIKKTDATDSPTSSKIAKYNSSSNLKAYQFQMTKSSDSGMNSSSYIPYMNGDGLIFKSSISNFLNAINVYNKTESDNRYVQKSDNDGVPPGTIIAFAGSLSNKPAGFLHCDGSSISKSTYSKLYSAIGTTYGSNGSNFNLPDFRGMFLRGIGGNAAGLGSKQGDAIRNMTGSMTAFTDYVLYDSASGVFNLSGSSRSSFRNSETGYNKPSKVNFNASRAVPTANENRPENYAIYWLIKY
ncbi:hypothetical protein BFG04_03905 [Campylobacter pinnipediorum subsp. pinnipediorum]|uniref:Phage tail collar domain-containing protein n=1 Tax=Campylobacter pinnipediorum subsp. pinnipediorum TaxID=1660067 RepID=A0AAX0L9Y8_9BACT|nr:tail fiber protein [Campylobacter pinnipediorum]OPA77248.1 hypothetical protein BFG04_03905 [Campylobacter pinnipediorum subsp. pinnipediorum]